MEDLGFRDSGEIGTAAYGLGVAHPTGFAADLLLLRAASLLPFGHIAFRQNLCVALTAAVALGLLAQICDALARSIGVEQGWARWLGAVLAAAGMFGWLTFAGTALCTEVYSLALACALLAVAGVVRGGAAAGLALLVAGFSPGLHVTAGLFALLALVVFLLSHGARGAVRYVMPRLPAVAAGALIVSYLPLASLRQPALDWGDPETPGRILAHLTAARIRSAYHGQMLTAEASGAVDVISQWLELWPLSPLAVLALAVGFRRRPWAVLIPLGLCSADLAYSVFINPMGALDRQVGHMAGASASLLAGVGAAVLCSSLWHRPAARAIACAAVVSLGAVMLLRLPRSELGDGYAAAELYGSGGPLAGVPPRAIVLCSNDDACAAGLFALHVERVRPDAEVLPAQHLWDATVLRRLRPEPDPHALLPIAPAPSARGNAARRVLAALASPSLSRPVLFESSHPLPDDMSSVNGVAAQVVPYFRPSRGARSEIDPAALDRLDRMRAARLDGGRASAERAQHAWSRAYSALGEQALETQPLLSLRAMRTAVQLAPFRAAAWINLGAALEAAGDLDAAIAVAERAVVLDPERATAWVNLARFTLRRSGPEAAREVLRLAAHAGVRDPRLVQLGRVLHGGGEP